MSALGALALFSFALISSPLSAACLRDHTGRSIVTASGHGISDEFLVTTAVPLDSVAIVPRPACSARLTGSYRPLSYVRRARSSR